MKIMEAGIDLIKSRESCRLKAYRCPAGVWTIGYGHTGPEVHDGMEITQPEADAIMHADLITYDAAVKSKCPDATPCQHSAMVSLCYNIGAGAFGKSSVARLHKAGQHAEAAQAFALWNKAGGKVLPGLVSRRAAEAALYLQDTENDNAPNADGEKPLALSKTINGQAMAGSGVALQAGITSLSEYKDTFEALIPYLEWAKYIVAALVIGGVLLTLYARWNDRREGRA